MIYKFTYNEYIAKDGEKEKIIFEVKEKFEDKLLLEVRLIHKETNQVTTYPKIVDIQVDNEQGEEFIQLFKNIRVYASDYFNSHYPEKIEIKQNFFDDYRTNYKGVGVARVLEGLIDYMRTQEGEPGKLIRVVKEDSFYLFECIEAGYKYLGGGYL